MDDFSIEGTCWPEDYLAGSGESEVECELGSLIAAASGWTEDEQEIDDLVAGLVGTGLIQLSIG